MVIAGCLRWVQFSKGKFDVFLAGIMIFFSSSFQAADPSKCPDPQGGRILPRKYLVVFCVGKFVPFFAKTSRPLPWEITLCV